MFATLDNFKTKKFHVKFIPSGKPRGQSNGGLPRGRGAALPLGQARGLYPGRSQEIKSRGFSLLEILIATVLGLLLCEVVLQNYQTAKNIYHAQTELAYLGENIRFVDLFLWQNITQAGFAGCRNISELNLHNHASGNFETVSDIYGYDSSHLPGYLLGKVVKGTDVIVVAKASADVTRIVSDVKKGETAIKVEKNPATEGNLFLLISDCKNADLFVAKNHLGKTINLVEGLSNGYGVQSASVGRFDEQAFFISNTARKDEKNRRIYGLYYSTNHGDKHELVSGVADMQVYYGIDNNLGVVNKYLRAKEITDLKLWNKVLSVRIELKTQGRLSLINRRTIYIKLRGRG